MLKSEIQDILKEIENTSKEITCILAKSENLTLEEISNVGKLYKKRAPFIEKINDWRRTEEAITFIKKNSGEWDKRICLLAEYDKDNISKINERMVAIGSELKQLIKNQSVLIYMEEESHEY